MSKNANQNAGCGFIAAGVVGLFCGFMTATTGSSFFPALGNFVASFLCNGQVIFKRKAVGLEPLIVCVDAATGQTYGVTIIYLLTATLFYGALYFLLLCLGWFIGRIFKPAEAD